MPGNSVLVQRRGAVATVTLDRPEEANRIDGGLAQELVEACAALGDNDAIRVVLLTGAGGTFATGLAPATAPGGGNAAPASALAALRKPTVAYVSGDCLDRGMELALACDVRVAAPGARFAMRCVSRGLLPADGGSQRLTRLVGRGQALRLLLTGDEISAEEALRIGLVQSVDSPRAVEELCDRIAAGAPIAAAYANEGVLRGADLPLEHGLRLEADLSILLHTTADRAEGLSAFAAHRTPHYQGR